MKNTGIREQGLGIRVNDAVQVVSAIAPASEKQVLRSAQDDKSKSKMTLAEVRSKLEGKSGKRYWKNLDELADRSFRGRRVRASGSTPSAAVGS
jgi:hypothetical protein